MAFETLPLVPATTVPEKPIFVTRPLLEGLDEVLESVAQVWRSGMLTNCGPQHEHLERELRARLKVPYFSLFNNGTSALLAALHVVGARGSVVTTPFTFPATVHAIRLLGLRPIFCDIDATTLNLDPARAEAAVERDTSALLPVHVYGRPCELAALQRLSGARGLRLVYDAAHAFGVEVDGKGIGAFGDASVFSFHATKIFHCVEGGGLAVSDPALKERADRFRNFGIGGEDAESSVGLNGKMSELHAAVGRAMLGYVDAEIERRRRIAAFYAYELTGVGGIGLLAAPAHARWNFHYFAIRIDAQRFGMSRDALWEHLRGHGIVARKYFAPLCSDLPAYRGLPSASVQRLPVATRVASEILCLPLYGALRDAQAERIVSVIAEAVC